MKREDVIKMKKAIDRLDEVQNLIHDLPKSNPENSFGIAEEYLSFGRIHTPMRIRLTREEVESILLNLLNDAKETLQDLGVVEI